MIDYVVSRQNMIESQVRPNGITDSRLIDAMAAVPRERFVPQPMMSLAYMDEDVPLATGIHGRKRFLMEPMAFARLVQAAAIQPGDIVLDVGCGTGYSTAVLSRLAQLVVALEEDQALAEAANENAARLELNNAAVFNASMTDGHAGEAPYNVIIINGRVEEIPAKLLGQLADGGRLVAVVGRSDTAQAMVHTRSGDVFASNYAFDASIPVLPGFEAADPGFVF